MSCVGRATENDTFRYVFKVGVAGLATLPKGMLRMTTDCAGPPDFDVTPTGVALIVPKAAAPVSPATCRVRFVSANRAIAFAFTVVLGGPPRSAARDPLPEVVPGALRLADAFRGQVSLGGTGSPDSGIAVGPTLVVLATNDAIELRAKSGETLDELPLVVFFTAARGPGEDYVGDPSVIFDPGSKRFFIVASANPRGRQRCVVGTCRSHLVLAISRSADPSGLDDQDWMFSSSDLALDQDTPTLSQSDWNKIAVSEAAVTVSVQPESLAEGTASGATSSANLKIRIFDRNALFGGATTPPWQDFLVPNPRGGFDVAFVFQAATNIDVWDRAFFASVDSRDCGVTVWAVDGTVPSAKVTSLRVPSAFTCATPLGMVQPAPGLPIYDSGLKFSSNLIRRGNSLWGVYTMRLRQGPFATQPSYLRWFQLDISAWPEVPRLVQEGVVGDGSSALAFPALTVSARGDMAMVFNRVSGTEYASAYYAGRLATDPTGTLRPMAPLKAGTAIVDCIVANVSGRNAFADYSGAAIDPADDSAWFVAQAATPGERCEWRTFVGHVQYSVNP